MRIALIDVDNYEKLDNCFPNLVLMKISSWHKKQGDTVEWYDHLQSFFKEPYDICYMSKVFSFTDDYPYSPNANRVVRGGVAIAYR